MVYPMKYVNNAYDAMCKSRKPLIFTGVTACMFLEVPIVDKFDKKPRIVGHNRARNETVEALSPVLFNEHEMLHLHHEVDCADYLKIMFDLAKEASAVGLIIALGSSLQRGYFTREQLENFVRANKGVRGMSNMRKVLPFVSGGDGSAFETLVRLTIHQLGREMPTQQLPIFDRFNEVDNYKVLHPYGDRLVGIVDMYYETRKGKCVFEIDGEIKDVLQRDCYAKEKLREGGLEQLGYKVHRILYKEFVHDALPGLLDAMGVPKTHNKPRKLPEINGLKNPTVF
ncbi:MAG: hypothetical protein LBN08_03970 [Lactobacillales bacterium]|nr:hypothetical protein [Lactobacillales bacterium]